MADPETFDELVDEYSRLVDRLYTVHCDFKDGSHSNHEGLTLGDTLAVVATFDVLDITRCTVEPA